MLPNAYRRLEFPLKKGVVAGIAFGDASRPIEILFLHANGLNALSYRALLAPIAQRFTVAAVDLRGHGRTTLPAGALFYDSWVQHAKDVIEIIQTGIHHPVLLAGHSLGAVAALLAAGRRPDLARGLCLIDPVVLGGAVRGLAAVPGMIGLGRMALPIAARARRRRARFESPDAAFNALKGKGIFAAFSDESLADYIEDGFKPLPNGGVELACRPAYEAATFAAQRHEVFKAFARAPAPLVVVAAEKRSTLHSGAMARMQAMRGDARVSVIEGTTHWLPWERPERVRAAIETAAMMAQDRQAQFRDLL